MYVGHTGTGFNSAALEDLHQQMEPLMTHAKNRLQTKVPVNNTVTWVAPQLVANIHYTEITNIGIMRHPVFHGLRIDKTVNDMKKETSCHKKIVPLPQKNKAQKG